MSSITAKRLGLVKHSKDLPANFYHFQNEAEQLCGCIMFYLRPWPPLIRKIFDALKPHRRPQHVLSLGERYNNILTNWISTSFWILDGFSSIFRTVPFAVPLFHSRNLVKLPLEAPFHKLPLLPVTYRWIRLCGAHNVLDGLLCLGKRGCILYRNRFRFLLQFQLEKQHRNGRGVRGVRGVRCVRPPQRHGFFTGHSDSWGCPVAV